MTTSTSGLLHLIFPCDCCVTQKCAKDAKFGFWTIWSPSRSSRLRVRPAITPTHPQGKVKCSTSAAIPNYQTQLTPRSGLGARPHPGGVDSSGLSPGSGPWWLSPWRRGRGGFAPSPHKLDPGHKQIHDSPTRQNEAVFMGYVS
jgi:hypothetical protein